MTGIYDGIDNGAIITAKPSHMPYQWYMAGMAGLFEPHSLSLVVVLYVLDMYLYMFKMYGISLKHVFT